MASLAGCLSFEVSPWSLLAGVILLRPQRDRLLLVVYVLMCVRTNV
jgi:hypothetical protein